MQFKQAIDTEMARDATEIRGIKHAPMFTAIYTSSLDNFRILFLFWPLFNTIYSRNGQDFLN